MSENLSAGGESRRRLAALAASGLLALTLGGELTQAAAAAPARADAAELAAEKDPSSRHIDKGLTLIWTGLKTLARHKVHGIDHIPGTDPSGRKIDEYFYSQPSLTQPNRYDQVVCRVMDGQSVPEACGIFFGATAANTLDHAFKNGDVLSRTPGQINGYKLGEITITGQGVTGTSYIKNGNKYSSQTVAIDGTTRSHPIAFDVISQVYDDFISNAVDMLKSADKPAA